MSWIRKQFNAVEDSARRASALRGRTILEARWTKSGGTGKQKSGGLAGPYGELLRQHIERMFASGPVIADANTRDPYAGTSYPVRWGMRAAMTAAGFNPLHMLREQLALLYQPPIKVEGEVINPVWEWLRARSGFDTALHLRQSYTVTLGSAAIRPVLRYQSDGVAYPVGVVAVPPDRCFAISDPSNPTVPIVYGEQTSARKWQIWDCTNPDAPVWGEWGGLSDWQRGIGPSVGMVGAAYPWWEDGMPVVPVVCHQFHPSDELLPVASNEIEQVFELVMERTNVDLIAYLGAYQTVYVLSDLPVSGLNGTMVDPVTVRNLVATGNKSLEVVPDSMGSVEKLEEKSRGRVTEWAQRYNAGIEAKSTGSAKSGYAIELELTGKFLLRERMATRTAPLDERLVNLMAITHNRLVRAGQMPIRVVNGEVRYNPRLPAQPMTDHLIPVGEVSVRYPAWWSATERAERRAELIEAIDRHDEAPQALYLFDRELSDDRPDGVNWTEATEHLRSSCAEAQSLAAQGYGQTWEEMTALGTVLPGDDASRWTASAATATTAAKGLTLRDEFRGRTLVGFAPQVRRLVKRAKAIANQDPQTMGEVRALLGWLEGHNSDRDTASEVGTWGDDSDPSGLYIQWLTQGGDDALAELRQLLGGADESEAV